MPEHRKRATKALIDVGCDRLGTVAGSGVMLLTLAIAPRFAAPLLLCVVVILAIATLPVVLRLHVGYVSALREALADRSRSLGNDAEVVDSAKEAPPSSVPLDRELLSARIEAITPGGLSALLASPRVGPEPIAPHQATDAVTLLRTSESILSNDAIAVADGLATITGVGPSTASALILLAHREHHEAAIHALRNVVDEATGQLVDALLDPSVDFVIRRRIPRVLAAATKQRAADGLLLGIADERFEVRYECGRALLRVTSSSPETVISRPASSPRSVGAGDRTTRHPETDA